MKITVFLAITEEGLPLSILHYGQSRHTHSHLVQF